MRNLAVVLQVLAVMFACSVCSAGSKKERHSHDGILKPYSGKHIPYTISIAENVALGEGKPVIINERNGKDGRGVVIQDVHAVPEICMDRIRDLAHYHKMVKNVKKVTPYDTMKFENGTEVVGAEFNVGLSLLTFTYFLKLKYDPAYFTLTWTLDYQYNSDFDDNTGHWQVVQHPTKPGWSRIVYSCEVKVFNWLPEFVINFMTKTALVESTAWVKRESEKLAGSSTASMAPYPLGDMSECFSVDSTEGTAKYMTNCAEAKVIQRTGHSDSVHSDL